MATEVENLRAARAGAIAKLAAAMTGDYSSAEEFKPDTNAANSLNRTAYIRELRETIKDLDGRITALEGAWEIITEVNT